ncbi:hypothetical protein LTR66_011713 [Elasticomyces elasticus]|nr:hypothetical protein LTR66_011713 [Elasticomyces elasticus]
MQSPSLLKTSPHAHARDAYDVHSHPYGVNNGSTSPPRTPQQQNKELSNRSKTSLPPSSYPKSARLAAATGKSYPHEEHGNNARDEDNNNDNPHNLTFLSKHIPRASMVDNMVLALDQFSVTNTLFSDPKHYVSSESDLRSQSKDQTQSTKVSRRSSARYTRVPNQLPSIFGEDEDSTRVRVYEAQRAVPPPRAKPKQPDLERMMEENGSDHELSHLKLLQGKLGPAGNRRSRSFDFGSNRRDELDANDSGSRGLPVSPTMQTATMGRRNSTKSTRGGKGAAGLSASAAMDQHASSKTISGKASPAAAMFDGGTASRRGFFSRFLGGSSRYNTPTVNPFQPAQTMERPSQDAASVRGQHTTTTSRPPTQSQNSYGNNNKENQPPLSTKKSHRNFFGRKRRPSYESVAVPKPLTLTNSMNDVKPGETSPISSLKAFMDPYLADGGTVHKTTTPTSPLQSLSAPSRQLAETEAHKYVTPNMATDADVPPAPPQKDTPRANRQLSDQRAAPSAEIRSSPYTITNSKLKVDTAHLASRSASSTSTYSTIRPVTDEASSLYQSNRLDIPTRNQSLAYVDATTASKATPDNNRSGSDVSEYKSAPSTPAVPNHITDPVLENKAQSPRLHVSHPSISQGPAQEELEKAKQIFENSEEDVDSQNAAAWLGEAGSDRERTRKAYMGLFDWSGHNILAALRGLCSRLVLKAESQLIDRLIEAFSQRWCQCNPNHGFRSADVVHTICYSILLLNTDLHMADISSRMTRSQFIKNSMQTIRPLAAEAATPISPAAQQFLSVKTRTMDRTSSEHVERATSSMSNRPTEQLTRTDSSDVDAFAVSGPLVEAPFSGSEAGWESQIEICLKDFYFSIQHEPLPLFGAENQARLPQTTSSHQLLSLSGLRRTPSVISNTQSSNTRSLGSKWSRNLKSNSSRPRLGSTPGFGSSKTSLDDQSSTWSPGMSSTWSKASLGKTLASMSVDSFGTDHANDSYKKSIGFASALSQAIIREDQFDGSSVTDAGGEKNLAILEDESLELEGAPWAKEGIVKHKCHFESSEKRAKDRAWADCFAVVEKGMMRLFSFSMTAKSLRLKAKTQKASGVVGGGNWQDNAEELYAFKLRHTIASALPPPGYSKSKPHVWALTLPTGAVHLFCVGTQDIVKEFVTTANFWSARLSKEPMIGGVSSMEYGWSDSIITRTLTADHPPPSCGTGTELQRPSTQMSMRSSIDHNTGSVRPRLPGDKVYVSDWAAPHYSLFASTLVESEQLKALQIYVSNVEEELQKHNELRAPMLLTFSQKHPNYTRAMSNWERKSGYLLKEIVKFKEYIAALQGAQSAKELVQKRRREEDEMRMRDVDSLAFYGSTATGTAI